jgi:glutamate N-acetyltransferase/amino-acid N-acetyltransferase
MNFPKGFTGSGVSAGLKKNGGKDLALIVNNGPQFFCAGVFTSNQVVAAPVIWTRNLVSKNAIRAVLINSGGANACTGQSGLLDTENSARSVSEHLNFSKEEIAICSTGMIGIRLPMDSILSGIATAASCLTSDSLKDCAEAIITTDSVHKVSETKIGSDIKVVGIAKGAGMLAPSLATMISVIMTDAEVKPKLANQIFEEVCEKTFNRIDSDGCTSTNDTVLFLASGASGIEATEEELRVALLTVATDLSRQLVNDAEGNTKVIEIKVINAKSERDAVEVGRSCARNNLLKCAIHGEDPNWGRVLAAIGTTNAVFDPENVDVSLNGVMVCRESQADQDRSLVNLSGKEVQILIDLHVGKESASILTNDLSAEYVHENSEYST